MIRRLKAVVAAVASMTVTSALADAVKINGTGAEARLHQCPIQDFVKEVNENVREVEIKWRGGPEVMPPFKPPKAFAPMPWV